MRYPYLLFDVGGTLIGPRESYGAVYRRALLRSGIDPAVADLDRALARAAATMARAIAPGVDRFGHFHDGEEGFWRRFVEQVFEELSLEPLAQPDGARLLDELRDAFARPENWILFHDTLPTLRALRGNGVRMAIVSNWDSRLGRILEKLELDGYFEQVVCSAIEGSEKPSPLLFRRAMRRLGARASQTLHVGDVPELDLEGARRAGIDARLVDRTGRYPAERLRIDSLLRLIE